MNLTAKMEAFVVSVSTLVMLISSKRPAESLLVFGLLIKSVVLSPTTVHLSTAKIDLQMDLPTGTYMPASALKVAISKEQVNIAAAVPTGRRKVYPSQVHLILKYVRIRTPTGNQRSSPHFTG